MKILLVTPAHPHLTLWQPQNLWRRALINLGHSVNIFRLTDNKWLNRFKLHRLINSWEPQQIFFSAGKDIILPIKHTVFFSGVPYRMLSRSETVTGLQAKLVVANDPAHAKSWLKRGAKQAICLPISAIDPKLHRPTPPLPRYQADVVFIGGLSLERQKLFQKLMKSKINLKLYGTLPDGFLAPSLKSIYAGPVWGKTITQIYSSCSIALNPVPPHMPTGGNLRTFEIPACGAFQLASRTNPNWFVSSREIVIYQHAPDLIAKIDYYLHHPQARRKIAQAGYKRVHHDHTYKKRFKLLLQLLAALPPHS
ncbi:MAG: hypothetical protein A2784_00685 [Candidatus Chisholmbacteria bacterium RIFCSPHIGHO2_01_FULL_48_12]|uniref:Spore protein YkvP/CgeB glycosyl transferase-like domain-containing protein n=1 Tax=Candidatus Chisholmbacteria bacterium RIFCSPHIGHO2_01_FULL_48_12 TaxID=1797589 RepID=A0A1G1VQC8_9BACT|nr:MAG: hypothetical protein A2784_00685 [Candidatus Chisholmbacteria bacterium RIFCSPHIGHO2_01_FULL_48_12]